MQLFNCNKSKVLVVGGAGYIGSHTCIQLIDAGEEIVVLDNLSNSSEKSLEQVKRITGTDFPFERVDIRDKAELARIFSQYSIDTVIHFAGLKAVGESTEKPISYFDNNIAGTVCLLEAMQQANVKNLVFSSSATVYGISDNMPVNENAPLGATNPYGRTKLVIEDMLRELNAVDESWAIAIMRYFNPIGAHPSGELGESPNGIPNYLLPYVSQVAVGKLPKLRIFGNDYPTHDGTGIRDYIHVMDLADGHIAAIHYLRRNPELLTLNLGTGVGYSVLDVVKCFSEVSGANIRYEVLPRRKGDVAVNYACVEKAKQLLGWQARFDLKKMCEDIWRWQTAYPSGFNS